MFQFPEPFPKFLPNPATSLVHKIEQLKAEAVAAATAVKAEPKTNGIAKPTVSSKEGDAKMEGDKDNGESDRDDKKAALAAREKEKEKAAAREAKHAKAESDARFKKIAEYEKREKERKAEGRIGTLVVSKSGRVKMVLGRDIVMDVSTVPVASGGSPPLTILCARLGHTRRSHDVCTAARPSRQTGKTGARPGRGAQVVHFDARRGSIVARVAVEWRESTGRGSGSECEGRSRVDKDRYVRRRRSIFHAY